MWLYGIMLGDVILGIISTDAMSIAYTLFTATVSNWLKIAFAHFEIFLAQEHDKSSQVLSDIHVHVYTL